MNGSPLLSISDLIIESGQGDAAVRLVDGFDLQLRAGERLALVGESGSGKTVVARAVIRLNRGLTTRGSIRLDGVDLLTLTERQMTRIRGHRIGMVFQDPMGALNPLMTVGQQIAEPLRVAGISRKQALGRARTVLDELGVAKASERLSAYPHEFSGGMRQRVVLALALVGEPDLLLADEPTTALDVRIQEQVLRLLYEVSLERKLAVVLITHDLATVAGFSDRVAVIYSGRKVHEDAVNAAFASPAHPYTAGLLEAVPRMDRQVARLKAIPGSPPHPANRPPGCAFNPRCPCRIGVCEIETPELRPSSTGGLVACHVCSLPTAGGT
jgi:peptide/nickel transport system ATP-binding protein